MALGEGERKAFAAQAEQAAFKRGEALFNDTHLGSTGLNCAACHPGGGTAGGKVGMGRREVDIPSLLGVSDWFNTYRISIVSVSSTHNLAAPGWAYFVRSKDFPKPDSMDGMGDQIPR